MEKLKEILSKPLTQMLLFALSVLTGVVGIALSARDDKIRNTPDMTDPRAYGTVTSIASSYTVPEAQGKVKEYCTVTIDFTAEDGKNYTNVFVYNVPFAIHTGDQLYIRYDKTQPNICSVVDDPPPRYHTFGYIFFAALGVFGIFGFSLAARRAGLHRIKEEVEKKNIELKELEAVKEGYGSYDGTGKANTDAAPFSTQIDYNQIYDENQGVMNSFYDPTALYTGYDENASEELELYTGYEEPENHI